MAKMLPSAVRDGTSSPAEHAMFAHMRDELAGDWTVLHSLGLMIHGRKPWAEIDFVLIGPPGVICLEVKGGLVGRRDGIWYTTPQRGHHAGLAGSRNRRSSRSDPLRLSSGGSYSSVTREAQGRSLAMRSPPPTWSGQSTAPISTLRSCMTSVIARGRSLISWIGLSSTGRSD